MEVEEEHVDFFSSFLVEDDIVRHFFFLLLPFSLRALSAFLPPLFGFFFPPYMAPHSGGPAGAAGNVCSAATYENRVLKSE